MALLARERPADGRVFIWEELEGRVAAFTMPPGNADADAEFAAALTKPATTLSGFGSAETIFVEEFVELEPGGMDHARAVMHELGATSTIADVG